MKKSLLIVTLLILCSCTSLRQKGRDFTGLFDDHDIKQEQTYLTKEKIFDIMSEIKSDWKTEKTRNYNSESRTYKMYAGEFVSIPIFNENEYKIVAQPANSFVDSRISRDRFFLRSLYQGNYTIEFYYNGQKTREINFINTLKYSFSEANLYDIIKVSFENQDVKTFSTAVDLYKITFSNSYKSKDVNFMALDFYERQNDNKLVRETLSDLVSSRNLNTNDKIKLITTLRKMDYDLNLGTELLDINSNNKVLNDMIKNYLLAKDYISNEETLFLEKLFDIDPDVNITNKLSKIKSKRINQSGLETQESIYSTEYDYSNSARENDQISIDNENQQDEKAKLMEEQYNNFKEQMNSGISSFNKGNYAEAKLSLNKALSINKNYNQINIVHEYLAKSEAKQGNHKNAIEQYKKAISLEKTQEKKAELYYNMAISYKESGETKKYREYLTFLKQQFSNTVWGRKSSIELMKLK